MAPTSYVFSTEYGEEPVSRTYQYRKVMKPMLERKRRARINRCLDELKELMVAALQSEGENVSKLEKADILELTVRHLHTLKRQHRLIVAPEQTYADRFRAGFTQCAQEVSHFLTTPADHVDPGAGAKLLQHLGSCIRQLDTVSKPCDGAEVPMNYQQQVQQGYTPPSSPTTHVTDNRPVWRPW
ncbi:Enhancer of split mgamma helix-loop-helix [Carabus blaptoides fortunei]